MFSDEPSVRGPHNPVLEGEIPPLQLSVAQEPNQAAPAIPSCVSYPSTTAKNYISTTAPIHKISRGAQNIEPACKKSRGDGEEPEGSNQNIPAGSLLVQSSQPQSSYSQAFPTPGKITGVATIILPPHQSTLPLVPTSSPTSCSASSLPNLPTTVYSTSPTSVLTSLKLLEKQTTPSEIDISSSQAVQVPPPASSNRISQAPSSTTVIDLNLCNTKSIPADINNNDNIITTNNKTSANIPRTVTSSNSNNNYKDVRTLIDNISYIRNISIIGNNDASVSHNTCASREEFSSAPLNSLEEFLTSHLPFDFAKEIEKSRDNLALYDTHNGDEVFSVAKDISDKDNCKRCGTKDSLATLKTEPDSAVYNNLPTTVLPSFSVFNGPSPPSYLNSSSHYSSNSIHHNHHQHHPHSQHAIRSTSEDIESMTTSPVFQTAADMIMNGPFGLNRSDSGYCDAGSTCSSRTNSSSSSSSMDLDYDEGWYSEMVEERNYTDLTSVRPVCPEQELLTSIMNEDEEASLHVLLSDSGTIKSEPLEGEDYSGFSMAAFINDLNTPDFDSDGYSSSTDNEGPHYTQLEEASNYNFFSGGTIMGAFPPLPPVTPSEHTKMTIAPPLIPNNLGQPSPDSDQSISERWIVAKENLPDFRKLQDPSVEEEEKPLPSRRRSLPPSPKEKKKAARESPTLSEKSSSSDRKKPGRKKGQVSNVLHLWEFMRDLLKDSTKRGDIIEWISEKDGVFRVVNSAEVARLWGEKKKNKKEMTYEKMSRSLRYSRLEGYFSDLPKDKNYPKKLCFKFGPKSKDWF